jgi:hypothetical protein
VDELNDLLSTPALWEPTARANAITRFDSRIVDIFYDGLAATQVDFAGLREEHIPLPGHEAGYRKVMLLGTTCAAKTTVVRQLLGTDPETERFPSTSTAKTTVADTELVATAEDIYRVAVTFTHRDEVIDYLTENASEAARAVFNGKDDEEIARKLLDHVNQRFRFSYVLGRSTAPDDDDLVDDEFDGIDDIDPDEYGQVDLAATAQVVSDAVRTLRRAWSDSEQARSGRRASRMRRTSGSSRSRSRRTWTQSFDSPTTSTA